MKKRTIFIITMIVTLFHYSYGQTKKNAELNLNDYLGLNFKDSVTVNFCRSFGDFKIQPFTKNYLDYYFESGGIKFRLDSLKKIEVILIYSKNANRINQPITYKGPIPFNISLNDDLEAIESKLGRGVVVDYYGRYERIYQWTMQDSIKIAMYILLPRQTGDKSQIDYITFSRINNN